MKFLYTTNSKTRLELKSQGFKELKSIMLCGKETYCFSYETVGVQMNFSTEKDIVFSDTLFL